MTLAGTKHAENMMCKESKSFAKGEQITGLMQDEQYKRWITDVSRRFKSSQIKAVLFYVHKSIVGACRDTRLQWTISLQ